MQNEGGGDSGSWHEKEQARFLQEKSRERLLERVERLEKSVRVLRGMVTSLFVCIAIMFGMRIWEIEQATPVVREPIRPTADAALVAAHYSRAVP